MKKLTDQGYSSLEAITMITQKATGGDTKKLGFAFGDQQARMGILAMIQNLDEYRTIRKAATDSAGTVDAQFNQRAARDATVQWRGFMGTASRLAILLGTTLLPVMTDVLGNISNMVGSVADWAQANPELASAIMKGVAALITFRIGLGLAQYALGSLLGPFAKILPYFRKVGGISAFGKHLGIFGAIAKRTAGFAVKAFTLMRGSVMFLAKGVVRAGAMMLANPIVLIIAAIVLALGVATYLIYTHWDKISAAFSKGVAWVKEKIQGLPDWMKSIGKMMMDGLLTGINPIALAAKLINVAKYGVKAFKDYLGIKSPSRVFMALGGHVAGGLERGIDQNRHGPARAVRRMAVGAAAAGALSLTPMQAAARPGPSSTAQTAGNTYHITIKQQPGEDADAFADRLIEKIERKNAIKQRRSYRE